MLRPSQKVHDLAWRVLVDRHLPYEQWRARNCTSYEQGVIGSELWATRHQERLRLEIQQQRRLKEALRSMRRRPTWTWGIALSPWASTPVTIAMSDSGPLAAHPEGA